MMQVTIDSHDGLEIFEALQLKMVSAPVHMTLFLQALHHQTQR